MVARVADALVDPVEFGLVDGPVLTEETALHRVKEFEGTPVELYCDGGYGTGVGVIGFCVVDAGGKVLKSVGDCHVGFSNN